MAWKNLILIFTVWFNDVILAWFICRLKKKWVKLFPTYKNILLKINQNGYDAEENHENLGDFFWMFVVTDTFIVYIDTLKNANTFF